MRLIDADTLWNALNDAGGTGAEHGTWDDGWDKAIDAAIRMLEKAPTVKLQPQWIPVTERLPDDYDERFYMCVVENHESDPPMYLQYLENAGFGLWNDVFDEHTLGFIDSVFSTNEELGYEKVLAWMPLPEPYTPDGEEVNT